MSMSFVQSPLNVGGGTGDGRKSVQSPTFRAGAEPGGDGFDPPTPTFGSGAGPESLNMMERFKSVRTTTNYRHLLTEGGTAHNANDFVMRIDDAQGVAGVQQHSANNENENPVSTERRARLAAAAAGWTPKVRFDESSAKLEQQQQDGAAKDLGSWRQRSCDYRLGMKDGKDMSLWEPAAGAAAASTTTTTTTAGPAPGSIERKWRARSLDMGNGSHGLRPPLAESSGTLWRKQFREGAINMSSMENIPFSAWSLKQPLPDLAETQVFSHSDISDVSKEPSTMNSSGRFSNIGTDSTNSSLGPTAILSRMPSSAAEHQLPNFTENPTYSPASKRHTRTESRADKFERVDELGSIRSRRSSSHHSSQRHSFRDEELIVKSPAVPASHYNRVKSRFSEPSKPMAENEYSPPRGGYNAERSGESRSGQLRSQQLKTGSRMVDGVDDEEDPFGGAEDLPDRPKDGRKWSCCSFMEWIALLTNIAAAVCSRVIPQVRDVSFMGLMLWKWILLLLAILCGRLISGWAVHMLVFLLERNFLMRKRVLYFVYALRRGVKYCVWLALVLMAWNFMFDAKVENANAKLVYITKVLQCFLIAAVLFVIKVFLVKVLASSFHVGTYFERIRDSLFNQYVLETLSGPPIVEIEKTCEDEQKLMDEVELLQKAGATAPGLIGLTDPMVPRTGMLKSQSTLKRSKSAAGAAGAGEVKAGSGISVQHLHKMNQKNVSAWNMKRLIRLVRNQGVTTISQSFEDGGNGDGGGMDTEIRSEWQAKAVAKEIFNNVAKSGMTFIDEEDFMRFMQEEEAIRALALFDGAMESGIITRKALKSWVVNVYQERRALALSLSDTKTAVNKLHRILDVILLVLVLIIWLLVLGVATSQFLVFVSSQLLLIVFVFGNTLKTTFEAIVFLFIMHPFDVGDRCLIDGVQYVVEEMNILTTVFLGDANAKVWFPNSVLATKPIQNFYRSPDMGDSFDFVVSASTPAQKIGVLKDSIGKYIASKSHHWKAKFSLNVTNLVAESGKLQLSLGLSHTMNHQNFGEKVARRSELMWEMKRLFEELAIEYHLPPQEMHVKTLPGSTINVNQSS